MHLSFLDHADEDKSVHKELGTSQKVIAAAKKLGEKSAPKGKVSAASRSSLTTSARVAKAGVSKFKIPAKETPPAEGGQEWKAAIKRLDHKTIPVLQRMLRFFKENHKSKATKKKDLKVQRSPPP